MRRECGMQPLPNCSDIQAHVCTVARLIWLNLQFSRNNIHFGRFNAAGLAQQQGQLCAVYSPHRPLANEAKHLPLLWLWQRIWQWLCVVGRCAPHLQLCVTYEASRQATWPVPVAFGMHTVLWWALSDNKLTDSWKVKRQLFIAFIKASTIEAAMKIAYFKLNETT